MSQRKSECPTCGERYKNLGNHWQWNPDHQVSITDKQKEIVTGMLMGDGYVTESGSLSVEMSNAEFVKWLDDELGWLSYGEIERDPRENTFDGEIIYTGTTWDLRTVCHDDILEFRSWYDGEGKTIPSDISLTPRVLTLWFCSDGSLHSRDGYARICANSQDTEEVKQLFEDIPPSPTASENVLRFDNENTKKLYQYMHSAPPGFEYKWTTFQDLCIEAAEIAE